MNWVVRDVVDNHDDFYVFFFIEEQSTQMAFWTEKRQRDDFEDVKAFMLEVDIGDMNLI